MAGSDYAAHGRCGEPAGAKDDDAATDAAGAATAEQENAQETG